MAALRRVSAVVAEGADPLTVIQHAVHEASQVLGIAAVGIGQYNAETRTLTKLYGTHGDRSPPVGRRGGTVASPRSPVRSSDATVVSLRSAVPSGDTEGCPVVERVARSVVASRGTSRLGRPGR